MPGSSFDKSDGQGLANLYWRTDVDGQSRTALIVDIESGERFDLMMFTHENSDPARYFIYEPKGSDALESKVPPDHVKFGENKRFSVRITHSGNSKLEFDVTVRRAYSGTWSVLSKYGEQSL